MQGGLGRVKARAGRTLGVGGAWVLSKQQGGVTEGVGAIGDLPDLKQKDPSEDLEERDSEGSG